MDLSRYVDAILIDLAGVHSGLRLGEEASALNRSSSDASVIRYSCTDRPTFARIFVQPSSTANYESATHHT